MINCPKCNKLLDDSCKFCDECGTKLERPDIEQNENNDNDKTQEVKNDNLTAEATVGVENAPKKSPKKKIIIAVAAAAVVACLGIGGAFAYKTLPVFLHKEIEQPEYLFYLKDDNIKFLDLEKEEIMPVQESSNLMDSDLDDEDKSYSVSMIKDNVYLSKDGKYMFYPEHISKVKDNFRIADEYSAGDSFDLYYRCVKGNKEAMEKAPEKIAADVVEYKVSDAMDCVTYRDDEGNLFQYNFTESTQIDEDVKLCYVSNDASTMIYATKDGGIYSKVLGQNPEKIDTDVNEIDYISEDLSIIYYLKDGELYKKVSGAEKEKIAENVYSVNKVCQNGAVYYTKQVDTKVKVSDAVEDDMSQKDAGLKRPTRPTEPEYPIEDYVDPNDYEFYFDYWDALDAAAEKYSNALDDYYDKLDDYYNAEEKYEKALSTYNDKEKRDAFRTKLENLEITLTSYTFCYNANKNEVVLTEYLSDVEFASNGGTVVYSERNKDAIPKVKMSEIVNEDSYLLNEYVEDSTIIDFVKANATMNDNQKGAYYVATEGKATAIDTKNKYIYNFQINSNGNIIFFTDNVNEEKKSGELYKISVEGGNVGAPELYDSDVSVWGLKGFVQDDKFVYFKNMNVEKKIGDLYIDKESLGYDIGVYSIVQNNGKIAFLTDWDNEKEYGNLNTYSITNDEVKEQNPQNKPQPIKIASEVYISSIMNNGDVLYVTNYSNKHYKGTLNIYRNDASAKIDDDVMGVLGYKEKDVVGVNESVEVYEETTETATDSE